MDLFILLVPIVVLVALIAILFVLAERSANRQKGSRMRRGQDESNAAGRVLEKYFRW